MVCGQRVTQVWHCAQIQMVRLFSTASSRPYWSSRSIRFGLMSISSATGQPTVHFWHW